RIKDLDDDGVPYDRTILLQLGAGERAQITRVPHRGFTVVGMISSTEGPTPSEGATVARLVLMAADGSRVDVPIVAGRDTAPAQLPAGYRADGSLRELRPWSWVAEGDAVEFLSHVGIPPITLDSVGVESVCP